MVLLPALTGLEIQKASLWQCQCWVAVRAGWHYGHAVTKLKGSAWASSVPAKIMGLILAQLERVQKV
jgi:hypothetical protein